MAITLPNGQKVTLMQPALRAYLASEIALRLAEKAHAKAFQNAFPIGSEIQWMRGEYVQRGEVILHGYSARLKALNYKTQREVWIDSYAIRLFHERATSPTPAEPR